MTTAAVLVGYDGSKSADRAVAWAAAEASRLRADLRAVTVLDPPDLPLHPVGSYPPDLARQLKQQAKDGLQAAVDSVRERWPGLAVEAVLTVGSRVPVLLDQSGRSARALSRGRRHG